MTEKVMNIYQRRNAAKKEVRAHNFEKIAGEGLNYKYLPVETIKPVVEDAWNNAGVVMDILDIEYESLREPWITVSNYGKESMWFHGVYTANIVLVNMDDPSDKCHFIYKADAKDNSDKSYSKAYTAILKNFYKAEFNISEGPKDDPDSLQTDGDIEKSNEVTEDKKAKRRKMAQQADAFFRPAVKPVEKPAETEAPSEPSEFVTADEIPLDDHAEKAKGRRASVNIAQAKGALARLRDSDDTPATLTAYLEIYGPGIGQWSDKEVIDCYLDLQDEGVL